MLAAAPINLSTIDEAHDVRYLFSRKAARRLGRPDQFMIIWSDGRHQEVTADQWWPIYNAARTERTLHWTPPRYMDNDKWYAVWAGMRLESNEYGRLIS